MRAYFIKNPVLTIFIALFCSVSASCSGDNGVHSGKDTVKSVYGSANDTAGSSESTIDTSKVKSGDNSASGGTKAIRDTDKNKPVRK